MFASSGQGLCTVLVSLKLKWAIVQTHYLSMTICTAHVSGGTVLSLLYQIPEITWNLLPFVLFLFRRSVPTFWLNFIILKTCLKNWQFYHNAYWYLSNDS
jgi:hypothetical protein